MRAALALVLICLVLGLAAVIGAHSAPQAQSPQRETHTRPAAARSSPSSTVQEEPPAAQPEVLEPVAYAGGTLIAQLEFGPEGVALLHLAHKRELPFRPRARGTHRAHLTGAGGTKAVVEFDPPRRAAGSVDQALGDELRLVRAPLLLKLPQVELPAELRLVGPHGDELARLELR